MKNLIKFIFILSLLILPVSATTFDVLVLPADIFKKAENYYSFEEVSEVISNDLIRLFNSSNGKIKSPDLYEVRAKLIENPQVLQTTKGALDKYKTTSKIDYDAFKQVGNLFSCKSVLLVSSSAVTNKNALRRSIWEVLEVSSVFNTSYPYRLETSIVLLDTVNDLVMWSNNYSTKLGTNENVFNARNYAQANSEYEKIKLYSQTVVAPSASQNIVLRFFPKTVRTREIEIKENSGGALRFERTLPEKPKQYEKKPKENFFGDMIYEI